MNLAVKSTTSLLETRLRLLTCSIQKTEVNNIGQYLGIRFCQVIFNEEKLTIR